MKRLHHIFYLAVALALLPCGASSTTTANITFTGSFVAPTCNFSVNNGSNVSLGSYPNTYFNTSTSSPAVTIPLTASGCNTTSITTIHMKFSGTADSSNNQLFAANGGVSGVAIELLYNNNATRLVAGSTVDWTSFNPSSPTWNFGARFTKTTGPVTAGTVTVPITINFTYN